jgi:hypothetical protein
MIRFTDPEDRRPRQRGPRVEIAAGPVTTRPATVTFPKPARCASRPTSRWANWSTLLLEPESDESFFAWGMFPEVLQRVEYIEGYAIAPLAEKMLAADPKLKAEFEAKLAAEPKFAADPDARLGWFYARTPYYDDHYRLYPDRPRNRAPTPPSPDRKGGSGCRPRPRKSPHMACSSPGTLALCTGLTSFTSDDRWTPSLPATPPPCGWGCTSCSC